MIQLMMAFDAIALANLSSTLPNKGYMINRGAIHLGHDPWYAVGAGLAIFICVLAVKAARRCPA